MDLNRLRALRELSNRITMAAVAEAMFLTPSAVSQQISMLEDETGIQLIERQGRGVRLTPAGNRLVAHADRLFAVLDEAQADMAAIKNEVAGTLRVAVFPTVGSSVLPAAIKTAQQQYPYLQVVLEELEPEDGMAALGSWHCDLAFVDDLALVPSPPRPNIKTLPLMDDALCALLPSQHRLAKRRYIAVHELKDERWALDSARSGFADFVIALCHRAGFEPYVNAHCRGFEILSSMVSEGCSVSVVAGLRLRHPAPGVAAVRLRPDVKRHISVAYRKGDRERPAIQVFLQALVASVSVHAQAKRFQRPAVSQ